jgi:hypothetical protein
MERKANEPADEDAAERQRNRDAVTTAAEASAALAKKAVEQQQLLKAGKREEELQHKRDLKKDTWKAKEKAKRDRGQQSRGKSTVSELTGKLQRCMAPRGRWLAPAVPVVSRGARANAPPPCTYVLLC